MDSLTSPIDDSTDDVAPLDDLSALAWIHDELRRSVDAAVKALRRVLREAEAHDGADVDAVDPAILRSARQHLHQSAGALELVGLPAAAALVRACEAAAQRYAARPHKLTAAVVADIERASFALLDYLGRILAGRPVSALALFPQYRAVQDAAGASRVHPADLWEIDWSWRALPADPRAVARQPDAPTRSAFEQQLLALMRAAPGPAMRRLSEICGGLGEGARELPAATLWKLAAAVFEAQASGVLAPDLYSKRVASRLLAQLRTIERGGGDVSERLAQDLVFFCAQAHPSGSGRRTPRLDAARAAYGLDAHTPADYSAPVLGRFDPSWIAQARKRVTLAKDSWSHAAGGEVQRLSLLDEQFSLVADSLKRIFPSGDALAAELHAAAVQTQQSASAPEPALAMEVATALLYIEASLEDGEFDHPALGERIRMLAARVAALRRDGPAMPLELWMEELYRRVSDNQTMGSVVQELRGSLSEAEALIDTFFRDPARRDVLIPVPNTLSAMRGVLSVLGMDQASAALLRMRDDVEGLAATQVDPERGPQAGVFERLADNLGALGFLIDMLSVQPHLAKTLFRFDAAEGTLAPVMGRAHGVLQVPLPADEPASDTQSGALLPAAEQAPSAAVATAEPAPVAAPADPPPPDDDDMRGVFIEEALEVIEHARAALAGLAAEPADLAHATTLRRAFHTLKGSARMVELVDFGDTAWACEQVFNTHLSQQKPAPPPLLAFTEQALPVFAEWTAAIAHGRDGGRGSAALEADAAALIVGLTTPAAAPTDTFPTTELLPDIQLEPARPAPVAEAPAAVVPPFALHFDDIAGPAAQPSAAAEAAVAETLPPITLSDALPDAQTADTTDAPLPSAEAVPADEPAAPAPVAESDIPVQPAEPEPDKQIGPLRIGAPLFHIYLAEAQELSRQLTAGIAEWAVDPRLQLPEAPIAWAHSLAGNSATVGFAALSRLSRLFEYGLMRTRAEADAPAEVVALFVDAAAEVDRLLTQFAAGTLAEPRADVLARLTDHDATPTNYADIVDAPLKDTHDTHDTPIDLPAGFEAAATESPPLAVAPEAVPPEPPDALPFQATSMTTFGQIDLKPLDVAPEAAAGATVAVHHDLPEADDDIDAVDAVDADLFPIFEEEAQDLLPQIAAKLRDWAGRPGDLSMAAAVMRSLHTLKGGARLSGAMRLGELAHRLEYRIEELLASDRQDAPAIDALQSRADRLNEVFEALRSRDVQRYADALAAAGGAAAVSLPKLPKPLAPVAADLREPTLAERPPSPVELFGDSVAAPLATTTPAVAQTLAASPGADPAIDRVDAEIDWSRFTTPQALQHANVAGRAAVPVQSSVRVRAPVLDRLVNQIGEVSIARTRLDADIGRLRGAIGDQTDNLDRLRAQMRDIELQAEMQMSSRLEAAKVSTEGFDPLEIDRYTRFQELARMMAESVNDIATVQRTAQRTLEGAEDELAALTRLARDLQDDLLRIRMVEFESVSDRLYRVVRQAAKETGKLVRLDIVGGAVELDRGVLDRMTPAFEHLLRNSMTHGIEAPERRAALGKDPTGAIVVALSHEGNEVAVEFRDDGSGLDLPRIRARAESAGLLSAGQDASDAELANLIFMPGFTTADSVTELAGRGVGMDVVRSDVDAIGGRIETATTAGQGTGFKLVLPLTTAVTQVVMLRCGDLTVAVPSSLIETVRRSTDAEVAHAHATGTFQYGDHTVPFFWLGALLEHSPRSTEAVTRTRHVVIVRSAGQRIALHIDEVLGNQEVVVKNLGPQLSRMPGLAGMTLLATGAVAPIYNPVALARLYGDAAHAASFANADPAGDTAVPAQADAARVALAPLVLVVDDSLTVRRVTQRLLLREGYRVVLAKDGLDAIERLGEELPRVVLSDIEMPRMDGFDLVRHIRADAKLHHLPVIMITSRIAHKHREHAIDLGVDHYLGKPYAEEELLALVGRYTAASVDSTV